MPTIENQSPVYSSLGGDPDLGELVDMFVDEMPDRIASLKTQGETREWGELRRAAHQLKGAAGSYGFNQVTPVAAALETSCNDLRGEEQILGDLDQLVSLCELLRAGTP